MSEGELKVLISDHSIPETVRALNLYYSDYKHDGTLLRLWLWMTNSSDRLLRRKRLIEDRCIKKHRRHLRKEFLEESMKKNTLLDLIFKNNPTHFKN